MAPTPSINLDYSNHLRVTQFPLADANGNCVSFIDEAGNVQAHYSYDAFGGTVFSSGAKAADFRFRFSSKYLDDETGLYYYGYRYDSPALGRWISRDPIGERGGLLLYGFIANNGVNYLDKDGRSIADFLFGDECPVKVRFWLDSIWNLTGMRNSGTKTSLGIVGDNQDIDFIYERSFAVVFVCCCDEEIIKEGLMRKYVPLPYNQRNLFVWRNVVPQIWTPGGTVVDVLADLVDEFFAADEINFPTEATYKVLSNLVSEMATIDHDGSVSYQIASEPEPPRKDCPEEDK